MYVSEQINSASEVEGYRQSLSQENWTDNSIRRLIIEGLTVKDAAKFAAIDKLTNGQTKSSHACYGSICDAQLKLKNSPNNYTDSQRKILSNLPELIIASKELNRNLHFIDAENFLFFIKEFPRLRLKALKSTILKVEQGWSDQAKGELWDILSENNCAALHSLCALQSSNNSEIFSMLGELAPDKEKKHQLFQIIFDNFDSIIEDARDIRSLGEVFSEQKDQIWSFLETRLINFKTKEEFLKYFGAPFEFIYIIKSFPDKSEILWQKLDQCLAQESDFIAWFYTITDMEELVKAMPSFESRIFQKANLFENNGANLFKLWNLGIISVEALLEIFPNHEREILSKFNEEDFQLLIKPSYDQVFRF